MTDSILDWTEHHTMVVSEFTPDASTAYDVGGIAGTVYKQYTEIEQWSWCLPHWLETPGSPSNGNCDSLEHGKECVLEAVQAHIDFKQAPGLTFRLVLAGVCTVRTCDP